MSVGVLGIKCSCWSEMAVVEPLDHGEIELAIWQTNKGTAGWRTRLRHIARILRHGDPYTDFIILDRERVEALSAAMFDALAEAER